MLLAVLASLLVARMVSPICASSLPSNIDAGMLQQTVIALLQQSPTLRQQCQRIALVRVLRVTLHVSKGVEVGARGQTVINRRPRVADAQGRIRDPAGVQRRRPRAAGGRRAGPAPSVRLIGEAVSCLQPPDPRCRTALVASRDPTPAANRFWCSFECVVLSEQSADGQK